jgi:voltage-gated potassium channel
LWYKQGISSLNLDAADEQPGMIATRRSIRRRVFEQLEPKAWPNTGLSPVNRVLTVVILAATFIAVISTEPTILSGHEHLFALVELFFGVAFLFEYVARLWTAAEDPTCGSEWRARWAFAISAVGIIDLLAALVTLVPFMGANAAFLRLLRLLRIVRLAKLGRLSTAMRKLTYAVTSRRYELALSAVLSSSVMLIGATALWWAEGDVQPGKFGSIPRALWWAAVTLTTIGYGDVYPVTPLGKFFAGILAIAGIGLIALPAGILAAAFSDMMQRSEK